MSDKPTFIGSCLCEGITFKCHGLPEKVSICYCDDCKKSAGGPCQVSAQFDRKHVKATIGDVSERTWVLRNTTSGKDKHKKLCSRCGCTLWTVPMSHAGEKLMVRVALLEDGLETLKPEAEIFASRKPSWFKSPAGIESFARMPGNS